MQTAAEKNKMKQIKYFSGVNRLVAFVLCLCILFTMLYNIGSGLFFPTTAAAEFGSGATSGVTRQADPSTMDTYKDMLDFSKNTRYAGRLWSDKTVFALGDATDDQDDDWDGSALKLTEADDGVAGDIGLNGDFLHVYSALGSSLKLDDSIKGPYDLVILLDMSGSMATVIDPKQSDRSKSSRIGVVLDSLNTAIKTLMDMHYSNRVAVVGYGATACTLMPLGHYLPGEGDTYLKVENFTTYGGGAIQTTGAYTVHVNAWKQETLGDDDSYQLYEKKARNNYQSNGESDATLIGFSTDMQAGIWQGFNELYKNLSEEDPDSYSYTYTSKLTREKTTIPRVPVAFVMTDGASNLALGDSTNVTGDEWHNLPIPNNVNDSNWVYNVKNRKYRSETSGDNGSGVILDILLTASYMKSKILNKYETLLPKIEDSPEAVARKKVWSFSIHTISVDTPTTEWQIPRVYATMDPKKYFNSNPPALPDGRSDWPQKGDVTDAYSSWENWVEAAKTPGASIMAKVDTDDGSVKKNWTFPINTLSAQAEIEEGVTNKDVIDNILYNDSFADLTGTTLGGYFEDLIGQLGKDVVSPVAGKNDLGIGDAVTYMDPIGKYMEVKDVKNLSLFGSLYDLAKTAVYDYRWNDAYMSAKGTPGDPLPEGWYFGEATENPRYIADGLPDGCATSDAAWEAGWVYRVSYKTAAQFVPTLSGINNPDEALAKERQTEYTFYRIDREDGKPLNAAARNTLRMNPAYGDKVPADTPAYNAETQDHLNTPGVYALSDLRIWVEDSGDYNDDATGDTLTDTNYDEALWVNIPANMLPLRRVTVTAADTTDEIAYSTNLPKDGGSITAGSAESASFPLRVFYTVGVSDEALEASNRINMAGAIDAEYILKNKITTAEAAAARGVAQGNVEFFSNWYNPLNRYGDYATTNTDYTYGDPVTSFSPANSNRYYLFEKALPLYSTAYVYVKNEEFPDGQWRRVVIGEDLTGSEDARTFDATSFGGRLLAADLNANAGGTIDQNTTAINTALNALRQTGTNIPAPADGDIVLLKDDILDDVTKPADGGADPFSSGAYYFLPIDYYELGAGSIATSTQYVITRKGSEFGSAYSAAGISNGDMLVWHDMSGTYPDYPYLSATDTKDNSRGRDWIGWPLDKDGYYVGCDKSSEDKSRWSPDASQYSEAVGGASGYQADWGAQHNEVLSGGAWVVCAKPGGLRVGGLSQAVQSKGGDSYENGGDIETYYKNQRYPEPEWQNLTWGFYSNNVTRTANNYYLPTISTASRSEADDIIVNVYLGNNGRLYVMDTTLLVTKTVERPDGSPIDSDEAFNFQVFIDNVVGSQSALVVQWNEATKTWQRQFHYIDLELDGQLFLQTEDGQKAMVDSEGCRIVTGGDGYIYAENCKSPSGASHSAGDVYRGDAYYVYIGTNRGSDETIGAAETSFRVYHNNDVDGNGTVDKDDAIIEETDNGAGKVKAATVWLVSASKYSSNWAPEGGAQLDPTDPGFDIENGDYYDKTLTNFELLTIDPNVSDTTEITITTPYRTASAYWTKEVIFGQNANPDGGPGATGEKLTAGDLYDQIIPSTDRADYFADLTNDEIAEHTAEFTLKHGQALLFSGIPNAAVYRFTEKLTDAQMDEGYTLKEVSHNQQVGSTSTYRPGVQLIPVYYNKGTTYGWYGGGAYPSEYETYETEKGLMWAVDKEGKPNDEAYLHLEPFHHTNAVVWEAYSTMDANAKGDNHHQPNTVADGTSAFWLWNEASQTSTNTNLTHTVGDNPSCKSLEDGGCDEDVGGNQVRHYFFKDGEILDVHYEGEGSGYIRNIGRYITSPTVHFGVYGEDQAYAAKAMPDMEPNTNYTGVYSVFGNTGTYEEQAHYVNKRSPESSIAVTKVTGYGDPLPGAGFTLYEVDANGEILEETASAEVRTELAYMEPLNGDEPGYDSTLQIYTRDGESYPVHREEADGKISLYYFRPLTEEEKTAYYNGTLDAVGLDEKRIRAVAEFKNLHSHKRYQLRETTVPEGYVLTHPPDQIFDFKDKDGNPVLNVLYEVKNFRLMDLPTTGGILTFLVTVGAALAALCLYVLYRRWKRRRTPMT